MFGILSFTCLRVSGSYQLACRVTPAPSISQLSFESRENPPTRKAPMSPPNPFPDPETKLTAGQIRHVDESVDRKQKKAEL